MVPTLRRIAVVDDDQAVLKALARLLRAHAFHAETYESAHEFLAALPGGLPDCLIVDLQMPGMSGLELQYHLKQAGIEIPTIVITGHGDTEVLERCASAGAIALLAKPLQDTSLFDAIKAAMGGP